MKKILTGFIFTAITCLVLVAVAYSQTALDPLQGGQYEKYPDYLDHSCGGVKLLNVGEAGTVAMFRATTTCSTGGRGTKPKNYVACWRVTFAEDRYYILERERVLYWAAPFGQLVPACPVL